MVNMWMSGGTQAGIMANTAWAGTAPGEIGLHDIVCKFSHYNVICTCICLYLYFGIVSEPVPVQFPAPLKFCLIKPLHCIILMCLNGFQW